MSKAIQGAAMLAGAVGMGALVYFDPALLASPMFMKLWGTMIVGGIGMEVSAIAGALTSNRGMTISTAQVAGFRQLIYGTQRVGGTIIYRSTTGGKHDQYNFVIVLAAHECDAIVNLYLDGRQVYWKGSGDGWSVRNGVGFGGVADDNDHQGPGGVTYNFGGTGHNGLYCEARYGDQLPGDVIVALTANDPHWAATGSNSPWLGGCTYFYLKVEYNATMFPGAPEIKATVRGKNDIFDPRSSLRGYSSNWALIIGDILTNTSFGLGDTDSLNSDQMIAAANVCDEMVPLALGGEERRYDCHWHTDSSTAVGDMLQTLMPAAAGRLSRIGGEWYVWPAFFVGPTFSFDESIMTGAIQWSPTRSFRELANRITGTYVAPNYPFNDSGNLYDSNGWYDGTRADTFPFAFQPTSYPQYAKDELHGYVSDEYLLEDGGVFLPQEVGLSCVLSIGQAQRVAKIVLMRNRQQGTGTFAMHLAAWQMQPNSVFQQTFSGLNWDNKLLEVLTVRFRIEQVNEVPCVMVEFDVGETDPSVYEWAITEERNVYDVASSPGMTPYLPESVTGLTVTSTTATGITGDDGSFTPRMLAQWITPADALVTTIGLQYALFGTLNWVESQRVSVGTTSAYISGVIGGQHYNVRVCGYRASGAQSAWAEIDGVLVPASPSSPV